MDGVLTRLASTRASVVSSAAEVETIYQLSCFFSSSCCYSLFCHKRRHLLRSDKISDDTLDYYDDDDDDDDGDDNDDDNDVKFNINKDFSDCLSPIEIIHLGKRGMNERKK